MSKKEVSVYQQTRALLHKNLLKKWRMKRETLMEWMNSLFLLLLLYLYPNGHQVNDFSSLHNMDLGRVDSFNGSKFTIAYAPVTNVTHKIMNKVANTSFMTGKKVLGLPDEESIKELTAHYPDEIVRVIFTGTYSYHLKFLLGQKIPMKKEHKDHTACHPLICKLCLSMFLQTTTNNTVMEELMSVTGRHMKTYPFISQGGIITDFFIFFCIISFSPFTYYASINVTRERKKMKGLMTMMGLQDSAFWLSWGILYAGFIFIMALFLALVVESVKFFVLTNFMVVFILFLLYGLSLIALVFLMSVLVKKSFLTGLLVFLLTVFWGSLGFMALYRYLPVSLEWILSFLSPFAFMLGMAQLLHLDYDINSNALLEPSDGSNLIIATNFMLAFDTFLYLALMMYLLKILPKFCGFAFLPSSRLFSFFFFFLSSSLYFLLPDLTLDIYEGQITAILGHSGAGKSTLLNILSGLSVPTQGSVSIYNNKLSERADLENLIKITGVCPQSNLQFDFLTVRENLRLFAKIRGIPPQEVDKEVQRILLELEMKNIQDVLAQNLSGGQKRKLTFGIAILGDPQIFLLDEPTAGLDPFSRHRVWNLLKEHKADHVILFSTQFMDEADILADRKVFLSKGKLKCAGSSLFLKKKWGIGYHLSLQINEMCVRENITSFIKQHIPDAKLSAESEGKLVYTLPLETTYRFPDLYKDLDNCSSLGIDTYGVSMTTLNEVFLKLEGKSAVDESVQSERAGDTERLVEMEQILSSLTDMRKTIGGLALWGQQICAIARVRLLKLKHERKALLSLLLILAVGFSPLLVEYILVKIYQESYAWELSPHLYFLAPGQQPHDPLSQLLIINKTGGSIDDFIRSVGHQNIAVEVDASGAGNGVDDPSYNGAIIVSANEKNYNFTLACNTKRLNCFPVLMDIVSNGLLGMFTQSARIQTDRSTFLGNMHDNLFENLEQSIFWLILLSSCPPCIAMSSIDDYKLRISGLFPSAYWFGQALVDIPLYCLVFIFMYLLDYILSFQQTLFTIISHSIQIPCAIGYAMSLIFLTYVISFIFRKRRKNSGICSFCFFVVSMFTVDFPILPNALEICDFTECILVNYSIIPSSSLTFLCFSLNSQPVLHFFIFLFILRCLEWKCGKKPMRKDPFFRISPRSSDVCQNPEEPEGEDEDVQMERNRTSDALNSTNFDEKPVIVASCLRKEYAGKKKHCFSKRKNKIATRNVSFCVRKGEILGLLGHNGAGKSTSIKVITGDVKSTAGQVLLKGSSEGDTLGFLGYCPQENVLWPNLTVREHLEVFAAVKGLRKGDAKVTIARLVDVFKLQDQLKAPVKTLSEGVKRKLCFMLSILGNPSVVLLDEPSTGMDPEGQQQTWQAIRAIIRNTERGALLTTHYMAEAEAVCDRVAIMVSGKLRCIGSIQHLKSKFGKDYLLEMKMKTPAHLGPLHTEILRLFPQAARQERYSSLMVYKLPMEDVHPLAQAFFKLEKVKQSFDLEEYSLSQSTLEQVFLELSKDQELDGFDEELDPSVKWKLLPQEEP
uniref:ABC transporter domain-containing protein n=1 Tax=Castor canadensis TaxID=51338 RepID=A0A8C0XRH2_CASCN